MQYDYTTNIINLQDKNLIIDRTDVIDNTIYIYVHKDISNSDHCCRHCGCTDIKIQGYYTRKIKYLTFGGKQSYIIYKQRRFICSGCNKTFNENCTIVTKGANISTELKVHMLDETKKKKSFKDIASENNVSDTTVINEFISKSSTFRCKLTEIVCIDEFKASTIAGEYALIIGDPISGKILDILPSRKQDFIYHYFFSLPDEERFKVKYIVTDLYSSYKTIAESLFHQSIHIADRFHWISLATEAFNKTRINVMKKFERLFDNRHVDRFEEYIIVAKLLKSYYKFFLANTYNKEGWYFEEIINVKYLKQEMTITELIEYCLNKDEELKEAYFNLQSLYKIAKYSTFETAKNDLTEWCDKIIKSKINNMTFKTVVYTYKHWLNPIVNSFIINPTTKERIANGFIEGKNNFVKAIKRIGFGYKDFDIFRAKILYANDNHRPFKIK